ncbi:RDD family protein [Flagellimonas myxillae]|uniref:RDD family protein n=1 Tax=Flagellimonas myxillae TaxID=2942214 RepID=UPI00201EA3FE|nr:RDD family protein [Muricauda myxillae]MCL6268086.1 RDD family protein [Muricauda myxillae]
MTRKDYNSKNIQYASFTTRIGAMILDFLIAFFIAIILVTLVLVPIAQNYTGLNEELDKSIVVTLLLVYFFGVPILGILYRSLFECSKLQGTPGKAILGVLVVDDEFRRISLGKALIRNFVKIFSSLIFYVGYLVAAGNEKCVTWHDSAAGTFVIKK